MVDPVGIAGLAIAVIDDSIVVVKFFVDWVNDARHYGEATNAFRIRLLSEVVKLNYFSEFLKETIEIGKSRFSTLPLICQQAVSGLMEELEINIVAYRDLILKYNIEDLRKAYELQGSYSKDDGMFQNPSELARTGKEKTKATQKKASLLTVTVWGLFRKKTVESLITKIEGWNAKLMSLLLCGVSFGSKVAGSTDTVSPAETKEMQNLNDLRLKTGLKLKQLVANDKTMDDNLFKKSWIIEPVKNLNPPVYQLVDTSDANPINPKLVLVSFKPFQLPRRMTEPSDTFKRKVANLAKLLSYPGASSQGFRTLQCIGIVRHDITRGNKQIHQYGLVNEFPSYNGSAVHDFESLSSAIASKTEARPTLGERFRLALSLAETLFNFHSVDWLHKSIRSDNILLFRGMKCFNFSEPYLFGFEFSRVEGDQSTTDYDDNLIHNLYRHPRRQGLPDARFSILHDIYSLGVVLLEVGIWRPLNKFEDFSSMAPGDVKNSLIGHANARLPHYVGRDYADAVVKCLDGSLAGFLTMDEQELALNDENKAKILVAFWKGPFSLIEKGLAIK